MIISSFELQCPMCSEPLELPVKDGAAVARGESGRELRLQVSNEQLVEHLAEEHGIRRPTITPPCCPECGGKRLRASAGGRWCCQSCPAMFTLTPVAE